MTVVCGAGLLSQTLDCMEVDFGTGTFAAGQAYVALSRARSMAGMRVRNLEPRHAFTDQDVQAFDKSLGTPGCQARR
jgi:ATP-dependent DNA helicase PIF1